MDAFMLVGWMESFLLVLCWRAWQWSLSDSRHDFVNRAQTCRSACKSRASHDRRRRCWRSSCLRWRVRQFVELLYFLDTGLPWWRLCLMPFCLHSLCLGQRISWCWTPREDAIGSLGCHWLLGVLYVSRTPQAPSSRFVV